MNIAIIAHDEKKELMVQFCIAYCGVLSRNKMCATGTTGKMVAEATGLEIQTFLGGSQGGDQQIAARIACNEIDMLIFFRDPLTPKPHEPNDMNLCDGGGFDPRLGARRSRLEKYRQINMDKANPQRMCSVAGFLYVL